MKTNEQDLQYYVRLIVEPEPFHERKRLRANLRHAAAELEAAPTDNDFYVPSKPLYDFCYFNLNRLTNPVEANAAHVIMSAYICREAVPYDFVRVIKNLIGKI
jgi:hypothetical protein